jgi:hypothetical protein
MLLSLTYIFTIAPSPLRIGEADKSLLQPTGNPPSDSIGGGMQAPAGKTRPICGHKIVV